MNGQAKVRVPASTANLGPGFDVLGLALAIHNEVELVIDEPSNELVTVSLGGAGDDEPDDGVAAASADDIPLDESNYVVRGVNAAFRLAGRKPPQFSVHITQRVPVSRGLGSSAAALVGGALAANAVLGERAAPDTEVLFALLDVEGHAEQLAASMFGGLVAAAPPGDVALAGVAHKATPTTFALPLSESLVFVLAVPDLRLETKAARAVLPHVVAFPDAVWNVACATALAAGLADGDPFLLRVGMRDKLHQDARAQLCPSSLDVLSAARDAGAFGACWSGAGPTMLAVCGDDETAESVAFAMVDAFGSHKVAAEGIVCGADLDGCRIVELDREAYSEPDEIDDDEEDPFADGDVDDD